MSRADRILELVNSGDNLKDKEWSHEMLDWLSDKDDEELVEILRGTASTLAYRSCTHETNPFAKPTPEVFVTALKRIVSAFNKHVKESE